MSAQSRPVPRGANMVSEVSEYHERWTRSNRCAIMCRVMPPNEDCLSRDTSDVAERCGDYDIATAVSCWQERGTQHKHRKNARDEILIIVSRSIVTIHILLQLLSTIPPIQSLTLLPTLCAKIDADTVHTMPLVLGIPKLLALENMP
jgi:hypothetical protein